jgi:hypothetical protein
LKPYASWVDKNNDYLGSILEKLDKSKRVYHDSENYPAGFSDIFFFDECMILLHAALEFSPPLPEIVERRILEVSVTKVASNGVIDSKKLLTEINKLTRHYLDKKPEDYSLVTSIALDNQVKLPSLKVNGVMLQFKSSIPKTFAKGLEKFSKDTTFAKTPKDYKYIFAKVSARSQQEAVEQAYYAINFVRGIWNLHFNLRTPKRHSYGLKQPVNKIRLGPVHTLHNYKGNIVENRFWYEKTYSATSPFEKFAEEFVDIQKFYKLIRAKLKRSIYQQELENAIIRYVQALDETNFDNSFLKLWSILEHLTDTTEAPNETTARRTAFVFKENEYMSQILQVMKTHRNRMIHASVAPANTEPHVYILKNCVEELLHYHLNPPLRFESLKKAASFLDLPASSTSLATSLKDLSTTLEEIREKMELRKAAERYRDRLSNFELPKLETLSDSLQMPMIQI